MDGPPPGIPALPLRKTKSRVNPGAIGGGPIAGAPLNSTSLNRTTVSLIFQVGLDGHLMRRKTGLSNRSEDTLQRVYDTITGRFGGRPLWPQACANVQAKGATACFMVCTSPNEPASEASMANWQLVPPEASLKQLEERVGIQTGALKLLLRMQAMEDDPDAVQEWWNLESSAAVLHVQGTFIHVDSEDDDKLALSPRALSDPGSSHMGSLFGDEGLLDKQDGMTTRASAQDQLYIRKNQQWHRYAGGPGSRRRTPSSGAGSHAGSDCASNPGCDSPVAATREPAKDAPVRLGGLGDMTGPAYATGGYPECLPARGLTAQVQPQPMANLSTMPSFIQGEGLSHLEDGSLRQPLVYASQAGLPMTLKPLPSSAPMISPLMLEPEDQIHNAKSDALFKAVSEGDASRVAELFKADQNISLITDQGSHILFRAVIKAQSSNIVNMLLDYKANPRWCDNKGNQVMHFWARATSGRDVLREIGMELIGAGADVNAQRLEDGMSVLHHVVVGFNSRRGWLDFHKVLFLLRKGANPELVTHRGQTPLDLLQGEHRKSGCMLNQLLRAARQSGPRSSASWPTCERACCPWCTVP